MAFGSKPIFGDSDVWACWEVAINLLVPPKIGLVYWIPQLKFVVLVVTGAFDSTPLDGVFEMAIYYIFLGFVVKIICSFDCFCASASFTLESKVFSIYFNGSFFELNKDFSA